MAANKRYMVVGKWYGQRWANADFEVWESQAAARRSLEIRDNMNWDLQRSLRETEPYSDFHTVASARDMKFYADDNDARYIDVYGMEMEYDESLMSWKFLVGEPVYRLMLGPRGGVRKENF